MGKHALASSRRVLFAFTNKKHDETTTTKRGVLCCETQVNLGSTHR